MIGGSPGSCVPRAKWHWHSAALSWAPSSPCLFEICDEAHAPFGSPRYQVASNGPEVRFRFAPTPAAGGSRGFPAQAHVARMISGSSGADRVMFGADEPEIILATCA